MSGAPRLAGAGHSSPSSGARNSSSPAPIAMRPGSAFNASMPRMAPCFGQKDFPAPHHGLRPNDSASATPATDERCVFVPRVENGDFIVTALTHDGQVAWTFNAGPFKTEHGLGHSPVVYRNRVIIADNQDLAGRVLALDSATGHLLWQTPLSTGTRGLLDPLRSRIGRETPAHGLQQPGGWRCCLGSAGRASRLATDPGPGINVRLSSPVITGPHCDRLLRQRCRHLRRGPAPAAKSGSGADGRFRSATQLLMFPRRLRSEICFSSGATAAL